jgi:hypothetical protein
LHFCQVQLDSVFGRTILISEVKQANAILVECGILIAHVDDSANETHTVLDRLPKLTKLFTSQILLEQGLKDLELPLQELSPHGRGQVELVELGDDRSVKRLNLELAHLVVHARNLIDGTIEGFTADTP